MSASSVLLSLPQMVDLALNSPEVGVVNFNILHSILHVIIQQVDLLECKVEFKGNDSERVQNLMASSKPAPSLNLTEYIVTPGEDQKRVVTKKKLKKMKRAPGDQEEILVETQIKVKGAKDVSPSSSAPNLLSGSSMQTVVVVEPMDSAGPHLSVAISRAHFDSLEEEMEKIKDDIKELRDLPTNMGLIDALRNASVDKSSPVVDMFQILSLLKRVEANETGLNKLASMIEDLAKESTGIPISNERPGSPVRAGKGGKQGAAGGTQSVTGSTAYSYGGEGAIAGDVGAAFTDLAHRVSTLEDEFTNLTLKKPGGGQNDSGGGAALTPEQRLAENEDKLKSFGDQISSLDTIFTEQIEKIQAHLIDLEKEIGEIIERIQTSIPGGGDGGGNESANEIYNKLGSMQEELDNITSLAAKLLEEKEERQLTIDAMQEQIELLKTVKADREDLEDALADKADACAVNRKVSHDQFDAACDDLARGIEDALSKLTQQERLWQQALDEIQKEIETKLDKMELTPLRDFVHNKLKILQERLKALAALKKETEAAGTKSKFLRNVQCISCDKDVVMRKEMDPTLMPQKPGLPPTKSMAPYLAYELDALRKQQKCMPHSRNMNHFENAMGGAKTTPGEDHLCNRYCGGSHTVTTPQQRVTRLGHFLQQWGPEIQPAVESQIRGTDGQLYKSREDGSISQSKPTHPDLDDFSEMSKSSKPRTSLTIQADIVSARTPSAKPPEGATPDAAEAPPPAVEKKTSVISQSKGTNGVAKRSSISSGKRDSTASAGRASQGKAPASASAGSLPKQASRAGSQVSFKGNEGDAVAVEEATETPQEEAAPEPGDAESAAPAEESAEPAPEAPEEE